MPARPTWSILVLNFPSQDRRSTISPTRRPRRALVGHFLINPLEVIAACNKAASHLAARHDRWPSNGMDQNKTKAEWRSYFQAQFKPVDKAKLKQLAEENKAKFESRRQGAARRTRQARRGRKCPDQQTIRGIQFALIRSAAPPSKHDGCHRRCRINRYAPLRKVATT